MKKVKITVLKTTLDKELAKEYGVKELGMCPFFICLQTLAFIFKSGYNKKKECDTHGKYNCGLCTH